MRGQTIFPVFLLTILAVSLSTALEVQGLSFGTVYVRADGSIDPPTAPISTVDNVTYTFSGDVNDSIVIERDNIVVDGAGSSVGGSGIGIGITVSGRTNVTIKNMTIEAFASSIQLDSSLNITISGNTITNSGGIKITNSAGNGISGNVIANNGGPIMLFYSFTNIIFGNNLTNNNNGGIMLLSSPDNVISENNLAKNKAGIGLDYSDNNVISKNNMTDNGRGIELSSSSSNSISENTITASNYAGIVLVSSTGNSILANKITKNYGEGIVLESSSSNLISGNNVTGNYCGIELSLSSDNLIFYNGFVNNTKQVSTMFSSVNSWDNGSLGNHWDNYNGTDTNQDGIGDAPYVIDASNIDRFPLVAQDMIPEFPIFISLPFLVIATALMVMILKHLSTRRSKMMLRD